MVRQRSAKPLFIGSIPIAASMHFSCLPSILARAKDRVFEPVFFKVSTATFQQPRGRGLVRPPLHGTQAFLQVNVEKFWGNFAADRADEADKLDPLSRSVRYADRQRSAFKMPLGGCWPERKLSRTVPPLSRCLVGHVTICIYDMLRTQVGRFGRFLKKYFRTSQDSAKCGVHEGCGYFTFHGPDGPRCKTAPCGSLPKRAFQENFQRSGHTAAYCRSVRHIKECCTDKTRNQDFYGRAELGLCEGTQGILNADRADQADKTDIQITIRNIRPIRLIRV